MKFLIDAGHFPRTPGKRCPDDSMREYHFNAPTVRYVAAELFNYEGVEVSMATFEDGRDVPINERVQKSNAWGTDVFVSIHANAMGDNCGNGGGVGVGGLP
jgi:N-acetylmuramoyl-L-alanine amidase